MEILFKTWNDISIDTFSKLEDILNDGDLDEQTKNFELISLFTDTPINEIEKWSLDELQNTSSRVERFFTQEQPRLNKEINQVKIDDVTYKVVKDMSKFTVGQYLDFQEYVKRGDKALAEVLSTFLIPKDKSYADGYNIVETIKIFKEHLDIITARSLFNFFQKRLASSTKASLTSLRLMMKWMLWKNGIPKEMRKALLTPLADLGGFIS